MTEILKCYGYREELEVRLRISRPDIDAVFSGGHMDTKIVFDGITEDDYDEVLELFDDCIYNDRDISLAETLVRFLKRNRLVISAAESCTGGLVTSKLVEVAGASEVLYEGLVTYSNDSKMYRLGVIPLTLERYGAVSRETALEMANGLLNEFTDIGVSTTGIAGPSGGGGQKPVGLVYIGIAGKNSCDCIRVQFDGDRNHIRECAANAALFYALQHIKQYY